MLDRPPSTRYKVIERDRRLVTIDTWSGQETGASASSEAASLQSRSLRLGAGPQQTGQGRAALGTSASQASADAPSAATATKLSPWGQKPKSIASTERQSRIIGLVFAGFAIGTVLILTGLWIPIVIAMLVPQIRNPVWTAIKPPLTRYLNGS